MFYKVVLESVITSDLCCWHGIYSKSDKKRICKIIKAAHRLGCTSTSLHTLYSNAVVKKISVIMSNDRHPLFSLFNFLPSGNRLRSIPSRTNRYNSSFALNAIRIFNSLNK